MVLVRITPATPNPLVMVFSQSFLSVNVGGQNITGWRLPTTVDGPSTYSTNGTTSYGFNNPTTSEMSHLYYAELGNKGYYDTNGNFQAGYGLNNTGVFKNLVSSCWYWSGTGFAANPNYVWYFYTGNGNQSAVSRGHGDVYFAMAVLSGMIGTAPVPEPGSMLLIGSGLAALAGLCRKK